MSDWIPATAELLEEDVVRWSEAIWSASLYNGEVRLAGEQLVTARVVRVAREYVTITILSAFITEERLPISRKHDLVPHEEGRTMRKKKTTLLKGSVERQPWSDENARASLLASPSK